MAESWKPELEKLSSPVIFNEMITKPGFVEKPRSRTGLPENTRENSGTKYKYPDYFKGKKILVAGLGLHGGGAGAINFFLRAGATVTVTDLRSKEELAPSLRIISDPRKVNYVFGEHRENDFAGADLIIKGPGVRPDSPFLRHARKNGVLITNDIAIFLKECPAKIIGVTGTRGKSTASFLIWKFLKTKYRRVHLAGNIRKSVLELLPLVRTGDWVVLELSSFQLQDMADSYIKPEGKPEIAVLTNIYKDHLNWHKNFTEYLRAKGNIFSFQTRGQYLFANLQDNQVARLVKKARSKIISPRMSRRLAEITGKNLGRHYRQTVALATAVAKRLGVDDRQIEKILKHFRGLEGRQRETARIGGVHFINDTTSTMPDATIAALEVFSDKARKNGKKIILIAGGQDKCLGYGKLAKKINDNAEILILLPGTATEKIKNTKLKTEIREVKHMKEAVKTAYGLSSSGDYVLLSPGAASFGLFLNEFDRGKQFEDEIKILKQNR